jgi:branched-chain amino acid transport system substrate-binding protein
MRNIVALVALCLALDARAAPVKIGIINSMSGPETPIGENLTNAIQLALEDLNARGHEVQGVWHDDTGKPQVGLGAAERLGARADIAGIVGAYTSSVSSAVAKAAEQHGVPLVIPVSAKEEITRQGYRWVFRLSATTGDYAAVLLDMAAALGKPTSIAILNEGTDFGVSGAKSARAYAEAKGMKVVFEQSYSGEERDHRAMLARVKRARPDLVFMVSYVIDAMLLMEQARELGLSPMAFLGAGAGFATTAFARDRDASHGVFSSSQWTTDVAWPGALGFASRYEDRFGKAPTYHAATAYEAMMILGEVASKAGGDREKIRQALDRGSWAGIVGEVRFQDRDGYTNQNRHRMVVEQVQAGRHYTVWPAELASRKAIWWSAGEAVAAEDAAKKKGGAGAQKPTAKPKALGVPHDPKARPRIATK